MGCLMNFSLRDIQHTIDFLPGFDLSNVLLQDEPYQEC